MGDVELHGPGTTAYASATRPMNAIAVQRPAFVAAPRSADDVAAVVREAARRGLRVVPQATGHGAAGVLGEDVLLLSTAALDAIAVDGEVATVGAGARWAAVNAEAERHGLLGRAGSSGTVSVSGYTFGTGIGWLVRPFGRACAGLLEVEYVDGEGRVRRAAEDAPDPLDRDALWAFRGGGGVGVATALRLGLVRVDELWAGTLLWPAEALDAVVAAWSGAVDGVGEAVATAIASLRVPPVPAFPESLRGRPAVMLALASTRGPAGAEALLDAVRAVAEPVVDTWGPSDAARLATVHLDPTEPGPALGTGRWLSAATPAHTADVLRLLIERDSPLVQIEIRSVAGPPSGVHGAQTDVPAPFILHALGRAPDPASRSAVATALDEVRSALAPVDAGSSPSSWVDDARSVPDALPPAARERVVRIADAVDPARRLHRSTIAAAIT